MALSNSQYDHLMRTYEQKQLDNEFQLRKRYEKAYALIPELEEVDHSISSLSWVNLSIIDCKSDLICRHKFAKNQVIQCCSSDNPNLNP